MKKYGIIYKIQNTITNEVYIGKTTKDIDIRLSQHIALAYSGKHNTKFYNSIVKHGSHVFSVIEIDNADSIEELNKKEIDYISKYDSFNNGYNSTLGGDGGVNDISIEKCNIPIYCHNNEKIYKNSRKVEEELGIDYKMVNSVCRGNKRTASGYIFDYHTAVLDDILDFKIKRANLKKQNKNNRLVNIETGQVYDSILEASQKENISDGTVRNHCYNLAKDPKYKFFNVRKTLIVGDYHSQISNLKDCEKLMDFIIKTVEDRDIDSVFFMGDQFHTHAVIRLEVQDFWRRSVRLLSLVCDSYFLVGNHDMKGDNQSKSEDFSSMNVFDTKNALWENVKIINKPTNVEGIAMMPYRKDRVDFINDCNNLYDDGAINLLLAHQTFTGATYENGFYAEDGIDPAIVPQLNIISGHIHKQQQIGKCWYLGTPKWDTMSDANEDKGVWVVEFDHNKNIISKELISTSSIVSPIYKHVVNEGDEEPELVKDARNYIEFIGKSAWISKMKKKYKGKAQIKAKPLDRKSAKNTSKDTQNLKDFLFNTFEPICNVSKEDIHTYMEGLNGF